MHDDRPTLILSDLHLGKGPCSATAIAGLFDGTGHVVINGDAAELHLPGTEAAARAEVESLRERCRSLGAELTFIEGNHDLGISPLRQALLAEGRVLVTHGDAFDPCVAPWSPWARDARAAVERVLAHYPEPERRSPEAIYAAARAAAGCEWSDPDRARRHAGAWGLVWRPHAVFLILRYWRRYPALAAQFAQRVAPAAQVVVCGHSHHPGAWRVGERTILNTGHFEFPGRPYAVRVHRDDVELVPIERTRGGYRLGSRPRERLTLAPASLTASASTPVSMPLSASTSRTSSVATFPRAPGA